jgi:hypothetical protein
MRHTISTVPHGVLFAVMLVACKSGNSARQAPAALDAATPPRGVDGAIEHIRRGDDVEDVAQKIAVARRADVR